MKRGLRLSIGLCLVLGLIAGCAQVNSLLNPTLSVPTNPYPANDATGVAIPGGGKLTLSWSAAVSSGGGAVTYAIYFGENSLPNGSNDSGLQITSWTTPTLLPGRTYVWKVVATSSNLVASGSTWTFTTAASLSSDSTLTSLAVEGSTVTGTGGSYAWTVGAAVPTVTVALGLPAGATANLSPGTSIGTNSWSIGLGAPGAQTAVAIVVTAENGSSSNYYLTITRSSYQAPPAPTGLSPADQATGVALDAVLAWSASVDPNGGGTMYYDLYFGEGSAPPSTVTAASLTATGWTPPAWLKGQTLYTWRVEARDSNGVASSAQASFTTVDSGTATVTVD